MARMQAIYDTDMRTPNQGHTFFHCAKCIREKPAGISAKEWSRQQTAVTMEGWLQVWCTRHDINIALLRFEVKETTNG